MTHSTTQHTTSTIHLDSFEVRASFWPDDDGGPIHSVLSIAARGWHAQSTVNADELRKLAALLMIHADKLDEATAAREALAHQL